MSTKNKVVMLIIITLVFKLILGIGDIASAQSGLPDLEIINVYMCKTWMDVSGNMITVQHVMGFSVRNNTPFIAQPTRPDPTRPWINLIRIRGSTGSVPFNPAKRDVNVTYDKILPNQTVGPFVARGVTNGPLGVTRVVGIINVDANRPYVVEEVTKANNYRFLSADPSTMPWCSGATPRAFGVVFEDKNRNGRRDPGERGIQGVIIELWEGSRRKVATTTSRWDGSWSISIAMPGRYHISAIVPNEVRRRLGGAVSWTTPSRYYNVPLTGGGTGPYRFGLGTMPPPPPAKKPVEPRPEAAVAVAKATANPVVIGQDPKRRGADILITIRSRPVTYIWYEFDSTRGRWLERRATVTDYVDLSSIRVTAELSRESRQWIREELARKYPGARVRRPFWNLRALPTYRVVRNRVLADGTHEVQIAITRIPFQDPGRYDVQVQASTRGTSWPGSRVSDPGMLVPPAQRSTAPKTTRADTNLRVYLLETTVSR